MNKQTKFIPQLDMSGSIDDKTKLEHARQNYKQALDKNALSYSS